MIIECSYCSAKVDAKVKATYESGEDEEPFTTKTYLLACPVCTNSIVAIQETIMDEAYDLTWSPIRRVWPEPEPIARTGVPDIVGVAQAEAYRCFNAKAYEACAVMCGRALEAICKHFNTKSEMLAGGLTELLEKKIIDEKIYEWGEALREHRNIGAHAGQESITRLDAADLINFLEAICDYIFVLTKRFEEFAQRKKQLKKAAP